MAEASGGRLAHGHAQAVRHATFLQRGVEGRRDHQTRALADRFNHQREYSITIGCDGIIECFQSSPIADPCRVRELRPLEVGMLMIRSGTRSSRGVPDVRSFKGEHDIGLPMAVLDRSQRLINHLVATGCVQGMVASLWSKGLQQLGEANGIRRREVTQADLVA